MDLSLDYLRSEIIGKNAYFHSPYGIRQIIYADYTASGKTLRFIENYLIKLEEVYANTHTEDSYTGKTMTNLLKKAEKKIKDYVGANENNYIIPSGTGSTGAITKLCEILGLYLTPGLRYNLRKYIDTDTRYNQEIIKDLFKNMSETRPVIFVGPYEHHSNYLIWKESFCEVVEVNLDQNGEIDLFDLVKKLNDPKYLDRIKMGSFSAASNVTGIKTNIYQIAKIFHQHNALIFFDFAASAPYVEINMNKDKDAYFDAIFLSPHKFIGGPGSSGILVINKHLYSNFYPPTVAGGGTVDYVSPYNYLFIEDVEAREKAGTPGILQVLKAALALEVKDQIGCDTIEKIEQDYLTIALVRLNHPNIDLLGPKDPQKRISICSFNIKYENQLLHHKFVAKLLNDLFGIQSRSGCACAGPYGHRLLNISKEKTIQFEKASLSGLHSLKPGFVRVNFHYLMTQDEVNYIVEAIRFIATYGYLFLSQYTCDLKTGAWQHITEVEDHSIIDTFGIKAAMNSKNILSHYQMNFQQLLKEATSIAQKLKLSFRPHFQIMNEDYKEAQWFPYLLKK